METLNIKNPRGSRWG